MKFNYMKSAAMALAFACCVSSCSDFLEEENKTGATAELEYATAVSYTHLRAHETGA